MQLAIHLAVLALLASTSAAPAAASQSTTTGKSCQARQNSSRVKTTSLRSTTSRANTATPASSAAPTSSAVSGGSGGAPNTDIGKMLQLHDDFRAHYGAGKMTWSTELADYAQTVANTCKFEHSHGPYGENLAAGVGGGYNVDRAFRSWADEAKDYDWDNPGFSSKTGHFTQVVWKATGELGCASAMCDDGTIFTGYGQKSLFVVCEYRKPGNVVDSNNQSFRDNVGTYRD